MIRKISLALLALFFLSGCNTTKKPTTGGVSQAEESALAADFERNVGDRIFFAYDKSDLSDSAKAQLQKQVEWLKKHPSVKATVEGHCDERGTREYNLALGERRATAVQNYLASHGIESNRLDTISYGKERPAVIGNNEAAWSKNRRGVTVVK